MDQYAHLFQKSIRSRNITTIKVAEMNAIYMANLRIFSILIGKRIESIIWANRRILRFQFQMIGIFTYTSIQSICCEFAVDTLDVNLNISMRNWISWIWLRKLSFCDKTADNWDLKPVPSRTCYVIISLLIA